MSLITNDVLYQPSYSDTVVARHIAGDAAADLPESRKSLCPDAPLDRVGAVSGFC
ncbi:hypothetical protein [Roseovarius sp. A-2]|uniref:hypothetical protein n=1 Tax=Roseovarius sp. A-2 TaxID=1570360 RepID=UPI001592B42D|nr:hypothetical protein [Roseovarius sp. A-2]